jgi:DNA-binding HxlR family transcriptional regulator
MAGGSIEGGIVTEMSQHIQAVCDGEETTVTFVRDLFSRLGEKWPLRTLDELAPGPLRFTALMEALPGISHRVLTVTLRTLETDGMITRTSFPESPPRVEYEMTPLGESFLTHTLALVVWAQDHEAEITAHREGVRR